MSNHLSDEKFSVVCGALCLGYSVRESAQLAGVSEGTSGTILSELKAHGLALNCYCGQPRHRGWCQLRFRKSRKRQEFMKGWRKVKAVDSEMYESVWGDLEYVPTTADALRVWGLIGQATERWARELSPQEESRNLWHARGTIRAIRRWLAGKSQEAWPSQKRGSKPVSTSPR